MVRYHLVFNKKIWSICHKFDQSFIRKDCTDPFQWRDLHSKILDGLPRPIFFIFMQFSGKFGQKLDCRHSEMLNYWSTNHCWIHAMKWSGVSNGTNEICTMYIEEFILVDIIFMQFSGKFGQTIRLSPLRNPGSAAAFNCYNLTQSKNT